MSRPYHLVAWSLLLSAMSLSVMALPVHAGQASALNACELVSRTDIEDAMASVITSGERRLAVETASACRFTLHDGGMIVVLVRRPERPDWSAKQAARMLANPQRFHEVSGIGDSSFIFDMMEKGSALCVFRGNYYIQVSAFGISQSSNLSPTLTALARKVLAHL